MKGEGAYKDVGPQTIATLAVLYPSVLHVVASKSSGITDDRRHQGQARLGRLGRLFDRIDRRPRARRRRGSIPMKDVTRDNLGVAESVGALKDGKVDVFFWIGGVPTAAVKDLVSTNANDVTFINTGDLAGKLAEKYPGRLPAGDAQGGRL